MNRLRTTRLANAPRSVRLPASLLLLLTLLLALNYSIQAQSGRRPPRSPQRTATAEAVNPTAIELRESDGKSGLELRHKVKLLLARDLSKKHLPTEDTIYASFIKRLNQFTNVSGTSIGDLKREHAIKRAQAETESSVVLLQFDIDNIQNGKLVMNSPDLEVKYFVFAPRTGQQQVKGKLYYQAIGGAHGRRDTWPVGPPIRITVEAAGSEVAERLYAWLAVTVGTKQRPLNQTP
ncbi:MAG: hypothetical protein ACR2G5_02165 [Pyrinomonadaceae bacterium]